MEKTHSKNCCSESVTERGLALHERHAFKDARKRAIGGIKRTKSVKRKVMAPTERERTKLIQMGIKYARFIFIHLAIASQ